MKTVFITGAGGYIGSRMVEVFLNQGFNVIALDRFFFGETLADLASQPSLRIIKDDTRFFDKKLLAGVDAVIDLAAISNDPSADLDARITESINHQGALRVATLAKEMGVKKYILASSCSIYGAGNGILDETSPVVPVSEYAKSKIRAEADILKLADHNFCVTFLRNATAYGLSKRRMRFDLIINIMTLHALKNHKIFIMGGGQQWRPLVHLDDIIRAFLLVLQESNIQKINGQTFNVGSNEQNYQVYQVAHLFTKYFPGLVLEETPDDPDARNYHVNFDKIKNVLGFTVSKTPEEAILEIKTALETGVVRDSLETITVKYYKYLIEANHVLAGIKLQNQLF